MITVQIKTPLKDFFDHWLQWMAPKIPLKEMDRRVLSAYMLLYYTNKSRFEDKKTLNNLIFGEDTVKLLCKKLEVSRNQIIKAEKRFIALGILRQNEDGSLYFNPVFVSKELESLKKINIVFTVVPAIK